MKANPGPGELPYEQGDEIRLTTRDVVILAGPWYVIGDFYGYYAVREVADERPWILGVTADSRWHVIDKTIPMENL